MKYRKYPNWVIITIRKSHFLTESEVEENGKQQEEESTVLDARCQGL
jgi:hypothetical protein